MAKKKLRGVPELGVRIKRYMAAADLDASELSARTGISTSYMSRLLNGEIVNPTIDFVSRIAAGLGVTETELVRPQLPRRRSRALTSPPGGMGLVYNAPPLDAPLVPDTFERFFTVLGKLTTLPRQRQEQCLETMIELIESQVAEGENGSEGN